MPDLYLRFAYRDSAGEVTKRELHNWAEQGHYLRGYDTTVSGIRTFRKDRVVEWFDDAAQFLKSPAGVSPPRPTGPNTPRDERPQILFTGFAAARRAELEALSDATGLCVVKSVTVGLSFLCIGANAGPKKVEKARCQNVYIVRESDLAALLETGELPDYAVEGTL